MERVTFQIRKQGMCISIIQSVKMTYRKRYRLSGLLVKNYNGGKGTAQRYKVTGTVNDL